MSTLRLSQIEGSNQTITVPSGHRVVIEGNFQVPLWTTASRPNSPATGFIGYNTEDETFEIYNGTEWAIAGGSAAADGSSPDKASTSGLQLATDFPSNSNGLYYIKSPSMTQPVQMYVDFVEDGGGYDFYYTSSGPGISYVNDHNAGNFFGLNLWEGRSVNCWRAAARAVQTFDSGNFSSYWEGVGHVYKPNGGGNYTGCIMRSGYYGGNNCGEWRVRSGQRWWIRDSRHSEPNGDYNGNGFLRIYGGSRPNGTNISTNMGYNDGGAYGIGSRYLLSTNTKT